MESLEDLARGLDALQTRAQDVIAAHIRVRLDDLQARYPRHRFKFYQAMGREFVEVLPAFRGEDLICLYDLPRTADMPARRAAIVERFNATLEEINELVTLAEDTFKVQIGDVESSCPGQSV